VKRASKLVGLDALMENTRSHEYDEDIDKLLSGCRTYFLIAV
jgi:hypothetical protein